MVLTTLNTTELEDLLAYHPGFREDLWSTDFPYFDQRFIPRIMVRTKDCKTIIITDFSELNELGPITKETNISYAVTYTIYRKCCDRWILVQAATDLANGDRVLFDIGDNASGQYKVVFSISLVIDGGDTGEQTLIHEMECCLNLNCCKGVKEDLICKAKKLIDDLGATVNQWGEIGRDVTQKMKDLLMLDHYMYLLKNYCLSCSELELVLCALNKFKNC